MRRAALALLYFAVIGLIVFLADHREFQFIFAWIRAIPGGDKVGHFLLMGGLSFVVNYALRCRKFTVGHRSFLLGSIIVAVMVTIEEFTQLFIRYRTFDLIDLASDFLGIWLFGKLALRVCSRRLPA